MIPASPFVLAETAVSLVASSNRQCALADEGLRCWADGNIRTTLSSLPMKAGELAVVDDGRYCVTSGNEVNCWKMNVQDRVWDEVSYSNWTNARNLTGGYLNFCAITDNGVKCEGDNRYGQSTPPTDLKNPKSLALGPWSSCAATDDGIRCWGNPIPFAVVLFSSFFGTSSASQPRFGCED